MADRTKREKKEKPISDELIDKLLEQGRTAEDVNGLLKQLTKAVLERALQGEMREHLGYSKHDPAGRHSGNSRNGVTHKTLKGDFGEVDLESPRDRNGEFEPQIIRKNQTRWAGFDDLSRYARGMTTREIQGHPGRDVPGGGEPESGQRGGRSTNSREPTAALLLTASPGAVTFSV